MDVRRMVLRTGRFVFMHAVGPRELKCLDHRHPEHELLAVYGEHVPVSFVLEDLLEFARRTGACEDAE